MSDTAIRVAMEERLAALLPVLPTAYENTDFETPASAPFQRVAFMRGQPENPAYGGFKRLLGVMQVTLMYPTGTGPGVAEARAELVRAQFPRGLTLTANGVTVTVEGTPYVMAGMVDEGRWSVPVRIPYYANIS